MAILIGVLLALCSAVVLALPFVRRSRRGHSGFPPDVMEEARGRREAMYQEVLTLRLDYEAGTVPEREYRARLHSYRLRAAAALRDEKLLEERVTALDRDLEAEIQQARRSYREARDHGLTCVHCGKPLPSGSEVCAQCGKELPIATVASPTLERK